MSTPHTVVIGAGIGGLTAGALLLQAGHRVTILEAHTYPGGCAGTFYHKKFRFDAGATLAGGFSAGGPHARLADLLGLKWPVQPVDPAWMVHLPNGRSVTQWVNPQQWQEERSVAFPYAEKFWRIQEKLAHAAWDISTHPFPWPPASTHDWLTLAAAIRPSTLPAVPHLFSTIGSLAPHHDPLFIAFLDGQLLISAQTTSQQANALYGSAALDLPRRGVSHVTGGIGSLAQTLVSWIRENGGLVLFRQQAEKIEVAGGRVTAVSTTKELRLEADYVLANLTPWALSGLLGQNAPASLTQELYTRPATWGAFTLYLGLETAQLPPLAATHHEVILDPTQPLGEGNSIFISFSDPHDSSRAPAGMQTATISTHTAVSPWWELHRQPTQTAYLEQREIYSQRLLHAAEQAIPGIRQAIRLCLPGTPLTFEYYTKRPQGMVGGFPQTSIFKARGPGTGIPNLWLVGDSIFPGQSTAGVTLGGMRVAAEVHRQAGGTKPLLVANKFRPAHHPQP